jgi:RNA polymerase sigma factor (sigma-70 family)
VRVFWQFYSQNNIGVLRYVQKSPLQGIVFWANYIGDEFSMQRSVKQIFDEITSSNHPESLSLIASISRFLAQYQLQHRYSVSDIIHETYCRAYRACQKKQHIENPKAWIRATAHNVVREHKRSELKNIPFEPAFFETISDSVQNDYFQEDFQAIQSALAKCLSLLDAEQKLIFNLRIFRQRSWDEVCEQLVREGYKERKVNTLRKSYERLLKRLRKEIHNQLPADSLSKRLSNNALPELKGKESIDS